MIRLPVTRATHKRELAAKDRAIRKLWAENRALEARLAKFDHTARRRNARGCFEKDA